MKTLIKAVSLPVLAGILCLNMLSISYAADAARSKTDTVLTGSISVTMRSGEDDEVIPGGSLTLYKTGEYKWINTRYLIQLYDEFTEDHTLLYLDVETLDGAKAQELADWADKNAIEGLTRTIGEDGTVSFDNLREGLYLIAQKEAPQGYRPVRPFFVTMPFFDHALGVYIYDVDATPKTQKNEPVIPLTPLEPAYHIPAELTPAFSPLFPTDTASGVDTDTPPHIFYPPASPSEPALSDTGAGGGTQTSHTAAHGGAGTAPAGYMLPDDPATNTLETEVDTGNINPLPATGEGRKILAGAALCLLSGIALAAAVLKRVKERGR